MQIREIMTPNPEKIPVMESVTLAAEKMKQLDGGAIPVFSEDRKNIVGMVTDRDILVRAIAENRNPAETSIRDIMSKDVLTCPEDTAIDEAVQTMEEKKVRRLIVTNARGETVGIVSLGDVCTKAPGRLVVFRATLLARSLALRQRRFQMFYAGPPRIERRRRQQPHFLILPDLFQQEI